MSVRNNGRDVENDGIKNLLFQKKVYNGSERQKKSRREFVTIGFQKR